ncbi:hypothetical protein, partial [Kingella kingae]
MLRNMTATRRRLVQANCCWVWALKNLCITQLWRKLRQV